MTEPSTPIIDFEALPKEMVEWIKLRLGSSEVVHLCIQVRSDEPQDNYTYILTTQKIILLIPFQEKPDGIYSYRGHRSYFLNKIIGIHEQVNLPDEENGVEAHWLFLELGTDRDFHISLEPSAALKFTETLYQLLARIKPQA